MARPATASPDRAAQTVRMPRDLKEKLENFAQEDRATVNDYIVAVLEQHVEDRTSIDHQLRQVMNAAIGMAAPVVKNLEVKTGRQMDRDARLMAIEAALTISVSEAIRRMLQPPKEMTFVASLYAMIFNDAERAGLKGPSWDYVRSLGPDSPPPTEEHVAALSKEIGRLMESGLSTDKLEAVKSLDVWLGLAVHEHAETWSEFQKQREEQRQNARAELYALLAGRQIRKRSKK